MVFWLFLRPASAGSHNTHMHALNLPITTNVFMLAQAIKFSFP